MPIIKNSNIETPAPSSNYYGAAQDVSKAIWKNTVSLKANNEFAIFDFLVDRDQGDGSSFSAATTSGCILVSNAVICYPCVP